MINREKTFSHELEVFRIEVDSAIQFFYARLSIHSFLVKNEKALRLVNETPLFWLTIAGALQTSFFISLGRIFDQETKTHNVYKLLKISQDNSDIFSKEALEARKRKESENANEWIDDFMKNVYVPTDSDFRRLKKLVSKYRQVYENGYQDIRHKVFAHKEKSEPDDVHKLFEKINTHEVQKMLVFLEHLYICLRELFNNGTKPVLLLIKTMSKAEIPEGQITQVQEHMVRETEKFFRMLSSIPNQEMHRIC